MNTQAKPYYPNTKGITNDNGKPYKYAYEGVGYSNKRSLHEGVVRSFLADEAKVKLTDCKEGALIKLTDLYPDDTEDQILAKANVGFFNRTTSKVHYDLEQLAQEISEGDHIQVIVFNMPFGNVSSLTYFTLSKKELNTKGNEIIGAKISTDPLESDSDVVEPVEQPTQILKGQISTDPLA